MDNEELDLVELETEDGSTVQLLVERYFYYNGEEYVLLTDDIEGKLGDEASRYVMKVVPLEDENGEEMEEFEPVDDELTDQLIDVIANNFGGQDE